MPPGRMCHEIVVDHVNHEIRLDDLVLGFFVEPDPQVDVLEEGLLGVVRIGILANNIKVITAGGAVERPVEPDLPSELAWAKRMARETVITEMEPVLRWLRDGAVPHGFRQRYLTGMVRPACQT